jgi:hypothetical protein
MTNLSKQSSTKQSSAVSDSSQNGLLDNGKAPANNLGFRPKNNGVIKVQAPRREDLQPSYAQILHGDESEVEMHRLVRWNE